MSKYIIKKGAGASGKYPADTGLRFSTEDEASTQAVKIALEYRGFTIEAEQYDPDAASEGQRT